MESVVSKKLILYSYFMKQYLDLLKHVMDNWIDKQDRTWVGTRSVFGYQTRYDLNESFPLLTTKKVYLRWIIHELLWFLSGDTNIQYLVKNNVKIWNEWAYQVYIEENNLAEKYPRYSEKWHKKMEEFIEKVKNDDEFAQKWWDLGPVYWKQWRRWQAADWSEVDQLQNVLDMLKNDPNSRRMLLSGWNVWEIQGLIKCKHSAPPPCHTLFQFYTADWRLSCQLYQRSADIFLWVPFNIASYSLLTMMIAQVTWFKPWEFIHTIWDAHIYSNHFSQVNEQLSRDIRKPPQMKINPKIDNLFDFKFEDFELVGYNPHPAIKAPIAV